MTIPVSYKQASDHNPASSSKYKSQKKTWERKRDLVEKRIRDLSPKKLKNEGSEDTDTLMHDLCANNVQDEPQNADKHMSEMCANNVQDEPQSADKHMSETCANNVREEAESIIVPYLCSQSDVKITTEPQTSVGILTSALDQAQKVQASLSQQYPSCVKVMLRSHVSKGFWLGMPKQFCDLHMPIIDSKVILVDEHGKGYEVKYLVNKNGLSGGWRGFAIAKGLVEKDVVIFQLIERCKLKVYIIRANQLTQVDGAIDLMNLESGPKPLITAENQLKESVVCLEEEEHNYPELLLALDNHERSDVNSGSGGSEVHDGIRFSESVLHFEDVKKFEDFAIHVGGLIIDSEFPSHVRRKYYELCCTQKMFLHSHFMEGLNIKLVTGVISETVNIADAIRQVKSTTSVNDLGSWEKSLKAFEDLGMVVGFLRARIQKLLSLSRDSEAAIESKRRERAEAESEMMCLKEKLNDVGAMVKRLDAEIDALKAKDEDIQSVFAEVAGGSW